MTDAPGTAMFDVNDFAIRRAATLLAVVAVVLFAGIPSSRASSDKELDAVLGDIDWGDSKVEVFKKIKAKMFSKLREDDELAHDHVKMQRARKEMMEKLDRIKKSYTELEGNQTGYEVSVISGEYTKNNNEALFKINDQAAQRFFFFVDGRFYKMVVAYRQGYLDDVGFEAFIGQVSNKYGRPDGTDYRAMGDEEEELAVATWKDDETLLQAKNKRELFGTYVMVFSDRKRVEKMRAKDGAFGGSDKDQEAVSNRVESLKQDSGTDENENVVDGMIGEQVEVDISHQDEEIENQGPTGQSDEATRDRSRSQQASAESSDDDESSKQQEEEKDRDFGNLSSGSDSDEGGDDELIVY